MNRTVDTPVDLNNDIEGLAMLLFRIPLASALAALFTLLSTSLNAADFCVDNTADLQTALSTAAANGADDQVQIVQGTYVGNFVYAQRCPPHICRSV
jgi:hypothetical protein